MSGNPILQIVVIGASVALLLSALAAPASAAKKPRCMGQVATIVGTNGADVIIGTAKRDVIVAKGGADKIWGRGGNDVICAGPGNDKVAGQAGHDRIAGQTGVDRLFGGGGVDTLMGNAGNDFLAGQAGPDVLAGGVGDDRLDGGIGVDTCHQNSGNGVEVRCELPVVAPPEPPTLVVAYSDVNTNHMWDAGDVLISKIVDTNGDGSISGGDTIVMGRYPTTPYAIIPAAIRQTFEDWGVASHTIAGEGIHVSPDEVRVRSTAGHDHEWYTDSNSLGDTYFERIDGFAEASYLMDDPTHSTHDEVSYDSVSPSQPANDLHVRLLGGGDDGFIDVQIYVS